MAPVLLIGCAERAPLSEVAVIGGTQAQRALASEELIAFERWIGLGRLELRKVKFKDLNERWGGRAYRAADTVGLDVDLELAEVRRTLRHELCHMLDYTEDLVSVERVFDTYGKFIFETEVRDMEYHAGDRAQRSEALAIACESGPLGASLLAYSCDGDPFDVSEMMAWVDDHVWTGAEITSHVPDLVASAHSESPLPWSSFDINSTEDPQAIVLNATAEQDANQTFWFMSNIADGGTTLNPILEAVPNANLPLESLPTEGIGAGGYGWAQGPAAAHILYELPGLGYSASRMIVMHDGEWALGPQPCVPDAPGAIFTAADQVWYAWGDGRTVYWMAL